MLFVTVGTHEQQFNRLMEAVEELKNNQVNDEDIVIQTGYSTYMPKNCRCQEFMTYPEMNEHIRNARIVITHGGPASFVAPIQIGKVPIVVPRKKDYKEHVNDHQVHFVGRYYERYQKILPVYELAELPNVVKNYQMLISQMTQKTETNNNNFNEYIGEYIAHLNPKKPDC